MNYTVVEFGGAAELAEFGLRLEDFIGSPGAIEYLTGDDRAIAFGPAPMAAVRAGGHKLFMNARAIEAARAAGLVFSVAGEITEAQLPAGAALLVGNASDRVR